MLWPFQRKNLYTFLIFNFEHISIISGLRRNQRRKALLHPLKNEMITTRRRCKDLQLLLGWMLTGDLFIRAFTILYDSCFLDNVQVPLLIGHLRIIRGFVIVFIVELRQQELSKFSCKNQTLASGL